MEADPYEWESRHQRSHRLKHIAITGWNFDYEYGSIQAL
jgi:hypothetical protein